MVQILKTSFRNKCKMKCSDFTQSDLIQLQQNPMKGNIKRILQEEGRMITAGNSEEQAGGNSNRRRNLWINPSTEQPIKQ